MKIDSKNRKRNRINERITTFDMAAIFLGIISATLLIHGFSRSDWLILLVGILAAISAMWFLNWPEIIRDRAGGENTGPSLTVNKTSVADHGPESDEIRKVIEKAKEDIQQVQKGLNDTFSETRSSFEKREALEKELWSARQQVSELVRNLNTWHESGIEWMDYIDRTLELEDLDENYRAAFRQAGAEYEKVLEKMGLTVINPEPGDPFDDRRHTAIGELPLEGSPGGMVADVRKSGYASGSRVIRPAEVWVTSGE